MTDKEKKYIIFFRAEKKFVAPRLSQFPFREKDIILSVVDIGDSYEAIQSNIPKIIKEIEDIQQFTKEIYLCGAVPNGFTWLLRKLLYDHFNIMCFKWLQMGRFKGESHDLKMYEIWNDLFDTAASFKNMPSIDDRLTQEEVDNLPDGTEIYVFWSGSIEAYKYEVFASGPGQTRFVKDWFTKKPNLQASLTFIGKEKPFNIVWLAK